MFDQDRAGIGADRVERRVAQRELAVDAGQEVQTQDRPGEEAFVVGVVRGGGERLSGLVKIGQHPLAEVGRRIVARPSRTRTLKGVDPCVDPLVDRLALGHRGRRRIPRELIGQGTGREHRPTRHRCCEHDEDALALLSEHYAKSDLEFTEARKRMARMPRGASHIDNPVSKGRRAARIEL